MPNRPQPPLHPGTGEPIGPDDLAPLFPMELIVQEVSDAPEIEIPDALREIYALWRPTPLYRARRLEAGARDAVADLLQVRGHVAGRQPQAEHGGGAGVLRQAGGPHAARDRDRRRPVGQRARLRRPALRPRDQGLHGQGLVRPEAVPADHDADLGRDRRPEPLARRRTPAGPCSTRTPTRRAAWGSRSPRRSRTRRRASDTAYSLGSVLNHVLMHQTVIGQEAIEQMELAGEFPDAVVGCVGGGSNFAGLAFPFLREKIAGPGHRGARLRAGSVPDADPRPVRVRLRRHEAADAARPDAHARPRLRAAGHPRRRPALPRRRAADLAARPRRARPRRGVHAEPTCSGRRCSSRAARGSSRRPSPLTPSTARSSWPRQADAEGRERTILFNLSGHGHFDLGAYDAYLSGKLEDFELPEAEIARALAAIESLPKPAGIPV